MVAGLCVIVNVYSNLIEALFAPTASCHLLLPVFD